MCVIVHSLVLIGQTIDEIWRFFDFFSKWRGSGILVSYVHVLTTHKSI